MVSQQEYIIYILKYVCLSKGQEIGVKASPTAPSQNSHASSPALSSPASVEEKDRLPAQGPRPLAQLANTTAADVNIATLPTKAAGPQGPSDRASSKEEESYVNQNGTELTLPPVQSTSPFASLSQTPLGSPISPLETTVQQKASEPAEEGWGTVFQDTNFATLAAIGAPPLDPDAVCC